MEYDSELEKNSSPQTSATEKKVLSCRAGKSANLRDSFKAGRPSLSCADFHHAITRNIDDLGPISSGDHHKQQSEIDYELVKYMSNLPSYLERGDSLQDKSFNVGVLDWRKLEKWHCNNRQISYGAGSDSPSSSNSSSFFSTDDSSTHSSRGQSSSPAQNGTRRPTLLSHLRASSLENCSPSTKSTGGDVRKSEYVRASHTKTANDLQTFPEDGKPSFGNYEEIDHAHHGKKELHPKIAPKVGAPSNFEEVKKRVFSSKGKLKTQHGNHVDKAEESNTLYCGSVEEDCPEKCKELTFLDQTSSAINELSMRLDPKSYNIVGPKVSHPYSPHRGSISIDPPSKTFRSKGVSAVQKASSISKTTISDPRRNTSGSANKLDYDKPDVTKRARSNPMRRLLNPFLKSKAENCHHVSAALQKDLISLSKACRSFDGRLNDSHQNIMHGSSTTQALLQASTRNGLPFLTFAVENRTNTLAATVDDSSCLYTFFTVLGIEKKSWINHRRKAKGGHSYIPRAVAQMSISTDEFGMRTFILHAVDIRDTDQRVTDFDPNDELAAVVVKIPNESLTANRRMASHSGSVESGGFLNTTVVLPSETHSLPNRGKPSSLIQRWASGGVCDCGGWDLGCKLRVLTNRRSKVLGKFNTCSITNCFELFSQEPVPENQPVFSLTPFKDGIYSAKFHSSLSLLQAFSICIAVLNGEARKVYEERKSDEF